MVEHFGGHPGGSENEEEFDAVVKRTNEGGEWDEDANSDEPFGGAGHRADEESGEAEKHGDGAEVVQLHEAALEQAPAIDGLRIAHQPGPNPQGDQQGVEKRLRASFVVANAAADVADGEVGQIALDLGDKGKCSETQREHKGHGPAKQRGRVCKRTTEVKVSRGDATAGKNDKGDVLKRAA